MKSRQYVNILNFTAIFSDIHLISLAEEKFLNVRGNHSFNLEMGILHACVIG